MSEHKQDAFENAKAQIKKAYDIMDTSKIQDGFLEVISAPKRIIELQVPLTLDDGSVKLYQAFRCQHNDAR